MLVRIILIALVSLMSCAHAATTLRISLPLGRTAYQTNEMIAVSVARENPDGLAAGVLSLILTDTAGGRVEMTFPVLAGGVRASEHFQINGALLRPGRYAVMSMSDEGTDDIAIEVYSHIRQSSFKIIDWGCRTTGSEQAVLGSLGFNIAFLHYGGLDADALIRGGTDYMWNCTMSGGSSMDLRRECDWSDPYVVNGGVARVAKRALIDRNKPNSIGVHLFDEPTLARWKHPETNEETYFNLPVQEKAFNAAFGETPIAYQTVNAENAQDVARFQQFLRWRLSIMDAVWKLSERAVRKIAPEYLTVNQGSWLFSGFGAGYYYNYQRSLPVYSGHGGYDYLYGGTFAPAFFYEFGRMRDYRKPHWYLPTWYVSNPDVFRLEQYMSFQHNVQGMAKPPDFLAHRPSRQAGANGLAESNLLMARLGTIFEAMPVTKPEVAVLYSISHALHNLNADKMDVYHGDGQYHKLLYVYMATKQLQVPTFPVVEEDILDGTFARDHRVLLIASANYLPEAIIAALERFIVQGGQVLISEDSRVRITGSRRFALPPVFIELARDWDTWGKTGQWPLWNDAWMRSGAYQAATQLATIFREHFREIGVQPIFQCNQAGVVASRQAKGDIEYIFAVNASPNIDRYNWVRGLEARITLPADGRPVYDAVLGGEFAGFTRKGQALEGTVRFGPGQMRVFARTARSIGGIQLARPLIDSDFTDVRMPIRLQLTATLHDRQGRVISGVAPLHIRVVDGQGVTRYDLYRATDNGVFTLTLPLAANDTGGQWNVFVTEMLANSTATASVDLVMPEECGAMAGAVHRAMFLERDRESILQFFRQQRTVTIVPGSAPFHQAAAERLAAILHPLNITTQIVPAGEANRARTLTEEEAATWVGIEFGRAQAGENNNPGKAGFAVQGPVILLGTPGDNPLVKFMRDNQVLPYALTPDIPGPGRGMLAWQTDMIGYGQESITCIADDESGMAEAVGTLYELATGMEPLTPLALPNVVHLLAGATVPKLPEMTSVWRVDFPDRLDAMKAFANGDMVMVAHDGTIARVTATGKVLWKKGLNDGENWVLDVSSDGKLIVVGSANRLYAFDGQGKALFDRALADWRLAPAVGLVAISPDNAHILVCGGRSFWDPNWHYGGKILMLDLRGAVRWEVGGPDADDAAKQLLPKAFNHARFAADGTTLALFGDKGVEIRRSADGALLHALPDIAGVLPPLFIENDRYAVEAKGKIVELSLLDGNILRQVDLPQNTALAALASMPGGFIIGTEGDSAVRGLTDLKGQLANAASWTDVQPTRIVKHFATRENRIAVSYWGGTMRILDAAGTPVAEMILTQDITHIAWQGNMLLASLADGRLLAFKQ